MTPSLLTWIIKPRSLPFLILGLIFFALFLSLGSYDQFSTSFELPPPPTAQLSTTELLLQQQLDKLREKLVEVCPDAPEPIYAKPLLTKSQEERYRHLQHLGQGIKRFENGTRIIERRAPASSPSRRKRGSRYMLTTTIRQVQDQLPDLLNTLLVLTMFLGPDKLSFSILEGPSSDCTPEVLEQVLHPLLMSLGVPASSIRLKTREQKIDFEHHNRIEVLAGLRNKAIEPLWDDRNGVGRDIGAVVFFNDVYMKARDVLELLHQHVKAEEESGQETGITSGWDWYERSPAHYYDVWVGRTVDTGDLFYPIDNNWWAPSSDLFHNSPASKAAFESLEPFPVFSTWNGMAIMSPTPFTRPHGVRFRRGDKDKGECSASECSLVCSDFWKAGWGRVQVVPSVQFAYERSKALQSHSLLKKSETGLGWDDGVPPESHDVSVKWPDHPPENVRCHPWPEHDGLGGNVWETTEWVKPWLD